MDELELLAFLYKEQAEVTLDELRARFSVSQVASRQLAILRVSPGLSDQVEQVDGVRAVFEGHVPQDLLADLDPMEKLFVTAWEMRKDATDKPRSGDGLDWDAKGFEAPGYEAPGFEAPGYEDPGYEAPEQ